MAAYTLSPVWGAGAQLFDNNGDPLSGGQIYVYAAGTTTPVSTFTTPTGSTPNTNPIVADAAGRLSNEIWLLNTQSYKFVLKDANNVLIATYDNIPGLPAPPLTNDASSLSYQSGYVVNAGAFTIGARYVIVTAGTTDFTAIGAASNAPNTFFTATGPGSGNGTAAYVRTVQTKLRETVSVKDFGAIGDGVADDTAAIQAALDYCEATGAYLYGVAGTYLITSTITIKCNGDLSAMMINANATTFSPAVQVGPSVAGQYLFNADLTLPKVTNTAKTGTGWAGFDTSIGVLSANVYQSRITVPFIYNFGVGIKVGGFGVGNVYNTYNIGVLFNNKINMQCKPGTASGWSNQNTFIGGRYGYTTSEGVAVPGVIQIQLRDFVDGGVKAPNTNVWLNPSIEGDEPQFHLDIQGAFNTFISPRFEVSNFLSAKVNFHAATVGETSGNYIYSGYMFGMTYTFSGAGTSVNNGLIGSRGGGTLDFSGAGYSTRNTSGNGITSPHFQGFSGATQPLPKDQTSTDWTYRLFAEGFAVKNPSDTAPRVAVDASGYVNFGGGTSVAGGLRYNTGAAAITSNIDFAPDADATLSLGKSNRQWSRIWATLPTYASNAAAIAGGLTAGAFYKTAAGEVRVVV